MNYQVNPDYMDDDWLYIINQFNMNFTLESIRHGYQESVKKEKENDNDDILRELGYSDADILNKHDLT